MTTNGVTPARPNLLLSGRPGIGKTTVITRLTEHLPNLQLAGFYTEEIREGGQRCGFRAVTLLKQTAVLAHVDYRSRTRVGRYGVDVAAFEKLALPELTRPADLMLIDEIGKMECFSSAFVSAVRDLLDNARPLVATVALAGGGFIAEIKARSDVEILQVTRDNRDRLPQHLADRLRPSFGSWP